MTQNSSLSAGCTRPVIRRLRISVSILNTNPTKKGATNGRTSRHVPGKVSCKSSALSEQGGGNHQGKRHRCCQVRQIQSHPVDGHISSLWPTCSRRFEHRMDQVKAGIRSLKVIKTTFTHEKPLFKDRAIFMEVSMKVRIVHSANLSSECWMVQVWGFSHCRTCAYNNTRKCGGRIIQNTGINTLGKKVPINGQPDKSFSNFRRTRP